MLAEVGQFVGEPLQRRGLVLQDLMTLGMRSGGFISGRRRSDAVGDVGGQLAEELGPLNRGA
ncbi:hypothetical protein [Mycolicibacterium doricum]|uniref:Uncharacterized protein n=1 Tax=Mycolicibacterium doricum TaxID=126673 RepID=A0A1X1TIG7_9MYCO|nr:hypothetical protein [Mycolicibacterium doricum]MCV7267979.1 hypothetical protein [Mycolicibacterium doricum]ORV44371.1 hypothetical protein AWC01_03610 [Mycolicibacterium doricum]